MNTNKSIISIKDVAQIGIFIAIIVICSWISIPTSPPITLQVAAVFTASAYLGALKGMICVCGYIILGIFGLPVFSNFGATIGHVIGPNGGFLIGFIISALIIGIFTKGKTKSVQMIAPMLIALLICYIIGTAWFCHFVYNDINRISIISSIASCVLPFVFADLLKVYCSAIIVCKLNRVKGAVL